VSDGLGGKRIALLESRLADALAALVRKNGGEPVCVPSVRELRRDVRPELAKLLDSLAGEAVPVFVFSTGVGVAALFDEARTAGRDKELREAIRRGISVCRGPKPVAALARESLTASVLAQSPFTTVELTAALGGLDLKSRMVVLLHYGERNEPLVETLRSRGVRLHELLLYEWALPEDVGPLARLVDELVAGRFAAAAFTSQIQARHLMQVAERAGKGEALRAALGSLVVAAVGPTCAHALEELGVKPQVVPQNPKMGAMLAALVDRLASVPGTR
jgi:uroporphyrinogen-III synthase